MSKNPWNIIGLKREREIVYLFVWPGTQVIYRHTKELLGEYFKLHRKSAAIVNVIKSSGLV